MTRDALSIATPGRTAIEYRKRQFPALLFPLVYPKGTRLVRMLFAGFLALVVIGAAVTLWVSFSRVESPLLVAARVAMILVIVLLVTYLVFHLRSSGGQTFVALATDGMYTFSGGSRVFGAWDTITATGPYDFAGCRYLGVRTSRPADTSPEWLRLTWRVNRRTAGWDMTYPLLLMPGGPAFAHLVERCISDPSLRDRIADEARQ